MIISLAGVQEATILSDRDVTELMVRDGKLLCLAPLVPALRGTARGLMS
jgi:hypothetical protein